MGKESEKEWLYVYAWLNHFAVHVKLTQHCKSTVLQYKIKIKKKNKVFTTQRCAPKSFLLTPAEINTSIF